MRSIPHGDDSADHPSSAETKAFEQRNPLNDSHQRRCGEAPFIKFIYQFDRKKTAFLQFVKITHGGKKRKSEKK